MSYRFTSFVSYMPSIAVNQHLFLTFFVLFDWSSFFLVLVTSLLFYFRLVRFLLDLHLDHRNVLSGPNAAVCLRLVTFFSVLAILTE